MSRIAYKSAGALSIGVAIPPFLHPMSPIRDAVTEAAVTGLHLHLTRAHLALTPYCDLADFLTILSLHELIAILIAVMLLGILFFRTWGSKLRFVLFFIAFLAAGILIPRPMARLVADDPSTLIIDFHSHTSFSHDGQTWFIPQRNIGWHRDLGFNAGFITDHNVLQGAQLGQVQSTDEWPQTHYSSLQGEEVSLYRTHLGVLGNHQRIDNVPFDSDPAKIPRFIQAMHGENYRVVAHLPEYWREHWKAGDMDFLSWDVDGFEIVNSVPYCLDFPISRRREIVEHCRKKNLFVTGSTDNHGLGYATAAWSVMHIPEWKNLPPEQLEQRVLQTLKQQGFQAVQVLEHLRYAPESRLQLAFSPLANAWIYWRCLTLNQSLSWILWIWLITLFKKS